jgi:hypothetical protein
MTVSLGDLQNEWNPETRAYEEERPRLARPSAPPLEKERTMRPLDPRRILHGTITHRMRQTRPMMLVLAGWLMIVGGHAVES